MAQLIPLPLTASCFSKIQIGFTFLVPAYVDNPEQNPESHKWLCLCVCVGILNIKSFSLILKYSTEHFTVIITLECKMTETLIEMQLNLSHPTNLSVFIWKFSLSDCFCVCCRMRPNGLSILCVDLWLLRFAMKPYVWIIVKMCYTWHAGELTVTYIVTAYVTASSMVYCGRFDSWLSKYVNKLLICDLRRCLVSDLCLIYCVARPDWGDVEIALSYLGDLRIRFIHHTH